MKQTATKKRTNPIDDKGKVQLSNDEHIDQDFNGYPAPPAEERMINPQTKEDRLTAKTEKPGKKPATKGNATKEQNTIPGKASKVESTLAAAIVSTGKNPAEPNLVKRIRKQKGS